MPEPVYYLADLTTRPTGHSLVSTAAPHIRWRRDLESSRTTTDLAGAGTFTAGAIVEMDGVLAVPAELAARLAIRVGRGTVLLNHAHIWCALQQVRVLEAA
jgi:hypothetical protein